MMITMANSTREKPFLFCEELLIFLMCSSVFIQLSENINQNLMSSSYINQTVNISFPLILVESPELHTM